MFSTAAALLIGLGTRIALDKISGTVPDDPSSPQSLADVILLGVVQGVGLYYALMEFPDFALVVAFAIAGRLAFEVMVVQDLGKCATTLLGVALGVLATDVLSQLIEDGYIFDFGEDGSSGYEESRTVIKRKRLVKFRPSTEYSSVSPSKPSRTRKRDPERKWRTASSITSITSSNSDTVDPDRIMDPLEREVATLRARASLADSERRRFKEEKKWALSQGNTARAAQMSWQVKRYTALTKSFTREADARLLEVNAIKVARQQQNDAIPSVVQNAERRQSERHTNHARHSSREVIVERDSTGVVNVTRPRHPSQSSSGNLKSAMRVQPR